MPIFKIRVDSSYEASIESDHYPKRNYSSISLRVTKCLIQDRINLIRMVCIEEMPIIEVAPSLGIKISTAKHILGCFRKDGKITRKFIGN